MENRIRLFQCRSLPKVEAGMEVKYRRQAFEIIYWLAEKTKAWPIFDGQMSSPGKRVQFRLLQTKKRKVDMSSTVTSDALPQNSLELTHLEVYDRKHLHELVPFRMTSCEINSPQYHRSVYLDVCGRYGDDLHQLDNHDLKTLFTLREKHGWYGRDSLYDAWLLTKSSHRNGFNMEKFEEKFPNWKGKIVEMSFTQEGGLQIPKVKFELGEIVELENCILISDED